MWRLAIGMIALILVGCTTAQLQTAGPLCTPVSDRVQVDLFFVTDRGITNRRPKLVFDSSRSDRLTYGVVKIDMPTVRERPFGTITSDFKLGEPKVYGSFQQFINAVIQRASHRAVLLYTHGFNEDLRKSAFRLGHFYVDGCLQLVPILFSWPSSGNLLGHSYDLDSATFARTAYFDLLNGLLSSNFSRVDLMAHSMGNWVMLEAMARLARERDVSIRLKSARRVGTVILASPDVDVDVFRSLLPSALKVSNRVVLLTSQDDNLLLVSRMLALGSPRAGQATEDELTAHGIVASPNFSVMRMDNHKVGGCPGLGHRCATANPYIVRYEKRLLEIASPAATRVPAR